MERSKQKPTDKGSEDDKMNCLDCNKPIDTRQHGQGTRIRCRPCQKINRTEKQKMYARDNYLRRVLIHEV